MLHSLVSMCVENCACDRKPHTIHSINNEEIMGDKKLFHKLLFGSNSHHMTTEVQLDYIIELYMFNVYIHFNLTTFQRWKSAHNKISVCEVDYMPMLYLEYSVTKIFAAIVCGAESLTKKTWQNTKQCCYSRFRFDIMNCIAVVISNFWLFLQFENA